MTHKFFFFSLMSRGYIPRKKFFSRNFLLNLIYFSFFFASIVHFMRPPNHYKEKFPSMLNLHFLSVCCSFPLRVMMYVFVRDGFMELFGCCWVWNIYQSNFCNEFSFQSSLISFERKRKKDQNNLNGIDSIQRGHC